MLIGSRTSRTIGAAVLALSAVAALAPAASGRPDPGLNGQPNQLGSQLDRIVEPRVGGLERALRVTEAETGVALRTVYSDLVQPRNVLGSRFDRRAAEVAQATIPQRDAFERAVAIRQAEIAARSVRQNRHQPATPEPSIADDGGSFDWGLVGALSAVAAVCLALGGAMVMFTRQRGRTAHP
jgi:hypothetical protein